VPQPQHAAFFMTELIRKRQKAFSLIEIFLIVSLPCVPLFATFPYRVNIFLSWEGAYRLSEGHIPYKDFGMPLGYMFWVVPALFMKIFGAQMITLVKAQVFINIISGLAFQSILKSLHVQPGVRLLAVLLYTLSFSFFNFWPWYNHTVIVYEMAALAFLLRYMFRSATYRWLWLAGSAVAVFASLFTKQDGGGLALLLCSVLLLCHCIYEKKWLPLAVFIGSLIVIAFIAMYPLTKYNFSYWFNYGQPPHTSRVEPYEILNDFFSASQWIKFYLFVIALLGLAQFSNRKAFLADRQTVIFLLLTLGILFQAAILQVTSYTPPDNNIYFHSFAIAFILSQLARPLKLDFYNLKPLVAGALGLLLWWSSTYWNYFQRVLRRAMPVASTKGSGVENVVNRNTYKLDRDTTVIPMSKWRFSKLKSLHKIYLPEPTIQGIDRLMSMDLVKSGKPLRVLNMSELTTLAVELPYELERGPYQPLWYHYGVAMFDREATVFENRIRKGEYDLVLFEYIPSLNNFYPFRVRDVLQQQYQKRDSFAAPRRGETKGMIEVYTRD
jgi:hypothetical protein